MSVSVKKTKAPRTSAGMARPSRTDWRRAQAKSKTPNAAPTKAAAAGAGRFNCHKCAPVAPLATAMFRPTPLSAASSPVQATVAQTTAMDAAIDARKRKVIGTSGQGHRSKAQAAPACHPAPRASQDSALMVAMMRTAAAISLSLMVTFETRVPRVRTGGLNLSRVWVTDRARGPRY